jgi:flagellin-like protein
MKGISPLIASVLLIAFTVAVAGLISSWLMSFTKTTSETVTQQSNIQLSCSYGGIGLSNLKYAGSTCFCMNGTIENTQTVSLGNITIQIIYINKTTDTAKLCLSSSNVAIGCSVANVSLSPRESISFSIHAENSYEVT